MRSNEIRRTLGQSLIEALGAAPGFWIDRGGHWLATSITYHGGRLGGQDVMARLPWTEWLSLPFHVMPIFFLAGGFANAASWTSHRARGEGWAAPDLGGHAHDPVRSDRLGAAARRNA
ncbi:hypothetical protein AB0L00_23500 [Actinoallomurus sp. NPDC052308]|uniref:hypothetical protein n=1 Tax=Actinoallomurus sp. NPDC052308 TaxID=3155530 RepID=UPI00341EDC39